MSELYFVDGTEIESLKRSINYNLEKIGERVGGSENLLNPLPLENGGTGSTTAALARAALSVEYIRTNANVLDPTYGAVGDGSDDLTAIQAAVDAADVIYFPQTAGGYGISNKIDMTTGKKLVGDGKFVSTLKALTNSQEMVSLVYGTETLAFVEICDLGLSANDKTGVDGISTVLASGLRFKDLCFKGLDYTFICDRGLEISISHILNLALNSLKAGRAIFQDSTGAGYLQHLKISDYETRELGVSVQAPALLLRRVAPAHIEGFNAQSFDNQDAIMIDDDCQGITISDCILPAPRYGIYTAAHGGNVPTHLTFTNIDIDQSSGASYQLNAGTYINVRGGSLSFQTAGNIMNIGTSIVSVEGLEINTGAANGILVNAGVTNFKITNNRIYNCVGGAIVVSTGASDYYRISGNDCSMGNGSKITDNGTGVNKFLSENL